MLVHIVQGMRYLFEAFFCYMIFRKDNNFSRCVDSKKQTIKRAVSFLAIYLSMVFSFYLIIDHPIIRLFSTFVIFFYFALENRKIRNLSYILTYSIFISLITESSYLLSYTINRFGLGLFSNAPKNLDEIIAANLVVFMCIAAVLHFCLMFLVYKFNFIKIKTVKILSTRVQIPIIFGFCLSSIFYMKYLLKEVPFGSSAVQTMCSVLLFVLPIYLALYHFISRHAERKNKEKNHIAEERIYDWIMHPPSNTKYIINVGSDSLSFLDKYNYITAGFIKNLNALGINDSCKEYSTLIFCLFITSMIQGTKGWSFEDDVFDMAEKLLNLPEETARKDIENIIKRTWLLEDYKTLKKEYYSTCFLHDYSRESSAPTVSEFLINMAKKNKMSLEELILDKRTSQPIARHAGLVSVHGEGILITGASGIGKSEAALELVDKGHRLVADDMVEIRRMNNSLYGNACQESRNFAESRGLGIVNVRRLVGRSGVMDCERIDLVINLVPGDDNNYDRLGEEQNWADILGVRVPYINVAVRPGRSLSNIIKIAAMNNRQKFLGFVAVNELYSNLGAENIPVKPKIINENAIWGVNTQV